MDKTTKTTEPTVLASTKVRSLECMTHPSAFMLHLATHMKTHTYTHKHIRIPISCAPRILPMSQRHAQFNPLKQRQRQAHSLSMQIKDLLIKRKRMHVLVA